MPGAASDERRRWPEWAAYSAGAWALAFAVVHLYWALGDTVGLPSGLTVGMNPALFAIDVLAVPLCVVVALLALSLIRPWRRPLPPPLAAGLRLDGARAADLSLRPHPHRRRSGDSRAPHGRPVHTRTVEPLRLRAVVLHGRGPLRCGGPGLWSEVVVTGAVGRFRYREDPKPERHDGRQGSAREEQHYPPSARGP